MNTLHILNVTTLQTRKVLKGIAVTIKNILELRTSYTELRCANAHLRISCADGEKKDHCCRYLRGHWIQP